MTRYRPLPCPQAGYAYMGGKMDDITVVICVVQQPAKL